MRASQHLEVKPYLLTCCWYVRACVCRVVGVGGVAGIAVLGGGGVQQVGFKPRNLLVDGLGPQDSLVDPQKLTC